MTTLIPTSQPTGVEAYEDMFKEITRKLYGDESAHGLYPHNTQVAQVAQLASGAPAAPEGGERSFTTLVSDRSLTQIDYETTTINVQQQQSGGNQQQQQQQQQHQSAGSFKSEEHLTTAFGLAALMQNGFPPPGAILNPVNFPVGTTLKPNTNISIATADDRWQTQTQQSQPQEQQQPSANEQQWSSSGKQASSYSQKPFKKPKIEPQDGSPTGAGSNNASSTLNIPQTGSDKKGNYSSAAVGAATGKRYSCSSCPYTTDRRDLFTRHENIHKEEKPFHCYACLKQFNRADHVKKHFLRMHRDMEYEIAKTRKSVSSKTNYYNNNTNATAPANNSTVSVSVPANQPIVSQPTTIQASTLNIPTATFPTQITIPTHHVATTIDNTVNIGGSGHDIATINGIVHHVQHQQQLPQQHQQTHQTTQIVLAPPLVAIKQEKGCAISHQTATATAVAAATTIVNNNTQQQQHDIGVGASSAGGEVPTEDDKSFVKKIKGEKRFTCCYCPWSGADNWGLKRHLNTHTKPFVCMLCDYKAARSERLATHVFKVHNKKACNKCNYLAEDEDQLNSHQLEAHPNETIKPTKTAVVGGTINSPAVVATSTTSGTGNVLRNLGNTFVPNNIHGHVSGNSFGTTTNQTNIYHTITTSASTGNILTNSNASNLIDTINAHLAQTVNSNVGTSNGGGVGSVISGNGIGGGVTQVTTNGAPQHHLHQQQQHQQQPPTSHHQPQQQQHQQQQSQPTTHHWIAKVNRKRGAELLYSYLEADGSDSEDYARLLNMQAVGRNKASVTQDFHNAGGGNQQHSNGSSSKGTNMLSLLAAVSSSASCSPTHGTPSSPSSSSALASPTEKAATGCSTMQQHQPGKMPMTANGMAMANLTEEHLSLLQLLATAAVAQQHLQQQQQQQLQLQQKATSTTISTSPPANQPHQQQPNHHHQHHQNSTNHSASDPANNNGSKRRRKSSSRKDKENLIHRHQAVAGGKVIDLTTNNSGTTGPAENGIERNNNSSSNNNNSTVNNKNINETIFDRVYKKPYNLFLTNSLCKPVPIVEKGDKLPREENFSLTEFLRNHKEVSISSLSTTTNSKSRTDENEVIYVKEDARLGRKQQLPRRKVPAEADLVVPHTTIPGIDGQQIADIRDKHLIRLITRKLCCRICQNQQRLEHLDNCHYHSKMSLILHNRWRHGKSTAEQCKLCRATFDRKYKLILHQRLQHSRKSKAGPKITKSKKPADRKGINQTKPHKQQKEQKRKSKNRSGGAKRRK